MPFSLEATTLSGSSGSTASESSGSGGVRFRFALKLTALMLAAIVLAALAIDTIFAAAGLIPESRHSIESITDRGITLNYTAALNVVFTLAGGLLLWLTISRGAPDRNRRP